MNDSRSRVVAPHTTAPQTLAPIATNDQIAVPDRPG